MTLEKEKTFYSCNKCGKNWVPKDPKVSIAGLRCGNRECKGIIMTDFDLEYLGQAKKTNKITKINNRQTEQVSKEYRLVRFLPNKDIPVMGWKKDEIVSIAIGTAEVYCKAGEGNILDPVPESPTVDAIRKKYEAIKKQEEKAQIILPKDGKLISEFAKELSKYLKDKNTLFFRTDSRDIVEIGEIKVPKKNEKEEQKKYTGFIPISPNRFVTLCEKYVVPGISVWNDKSKNYEFIERSISPQLAKTLLESYILQQELPPINRIFTVQMPIIYNGELTFPNEGYDERFFSWMPYDAPRITKLDVDINVARKILFQVYKEFCFKSNQDYCNAIAGLITPFLKGLYPTFNTLSPPFFYIGNRPRCGKDYCSGITGIVLEGYSIEEPAISGEGSSEELRKKILAALMSGRKRLHTSNNKGHLNNLTFEGFVTSETWSDRLLGKSKNLIFDNEITTSLSGNTGITWTGDFAERCIYVNLAYGEEDSNSRVFKNPDLHNWIRNHRGMMLSVIYSLIKNWFEKGKPKGSVPFTSFPIWSQVCGGIMESAGFLNPCNPNKTLSNVGGNVEEEHMKALFELCYQINPNHFMSKKNIKEILINEKKCAGEAPFDFLEFDKNQDNVEFGYKISRFVGREFSGITMVLEREDVKSTRQRVMFKKEEKNKKDFKRFAFPKNDVPVVPFGPFSASRIFSKGQNNSGAITGQISPSGPNDEIRNVKCGYCNEDVPYHKDFGHWDNQKDCWCCKNCYELNNNTGEVKK